VRGSLEFGERLAVVTNQLEDSHSRPAEVPTDIGGPSVCPGANRKLVVNPACARQVVVSRIIIIRGFSMQISLGKRCSTHDVAF
jgi:hypothetical protein